MSTIELKFFVPALAMLLLCTGCGSDKEGPLDDGVVMSMNGQTVKFESEQVSMTPEQVTCGIQNELFGEIDQSASRKVAPLLERGRALGFTDDVSIGVTGRDRPNTQVRGTFPVEVNRVVNIREHGNGAKRVEVWAGLRVAHFCFAGPLQIMGVRRGELTGEAPAAFEFARAEEGWRVVQVLHQ